MLSSIKTLKDCGARLYRKMVLLFQREVLTLNTLIYIEMEYSCV
nr:MAG TPA: hypothetical protein [Caudoviricetes sp.]